MSVAVLRPFANAGLLRLGRGAPPPAPSLPLSVTIHRQPLSVAADAQTMALGLWRSHRDLTPGTAAALRSADLLRHCGILSSETADGPLLCRRFADATVHVFGRAWAARQLGRPSDNDPHSEYALRIGAEYGEALDGGEPVYNRLVIHGLAAPVVYSHLLIGWRAPDGRRTLLTVIDRSSL